MIKALKDKIIVRQEYQKEVKGIVIPDSARKFHLYDGKIKCIVVSVGPDYPYDVKIGDRVKIVKHEGKKFLYEGKEYFVMKSRWVVGKYE